MPEPKIIHVSELEKYPDSIYCGRPSPFGNPFSHKEETLATYLVATQAEAVDQFEIWVQTQPELLEKIKTELKGKTLACWCIDGTPCHTRVLFKIANGYYPEDLKKTKDKNLFD